MTVIRGIKRFGTCCYRKVNSLRSCCLCLPPSLTIYIYIYVSIYIPKSTIPPCTVCIQIVGMHQERVSLQLKLFSEPTKINQSISFGLITLVIVNRINKFLNVPSYVPQ